MDQEDKNLLNQLSAIMQQIEQKGLLKEIDVEPSEHFPSANITRSEKNQNSDGKILKVWKGLYKVGTQIDTKFKLKRNGGTAYLEVSRTKKNMHFFRYLNLKNVEHKKSSERVIETVVLIKAEFLNAVQIAWKVDKYNDNPFTHYRLGRAFRPNILPDEISRKILPNTNPTTQENYVMCRLCLREGKGGYLRLYFSKVWSEMISNTATGKNFIDQEFDTPQVWTIKHGGRTKVAYPCKAYYRWESNGELLIHAPPWVRMFGGKYQNLNFNLLVSHSFDVGGEVSMGHLFKKKSASHFRCSKKKPWGFYKSMKDATDSNAIPPTGIVEFMVAFSPNAIFSESLIDS